MIDTALILAGGFGTRLRPLTDTTPKPLLPMKGKPIIQHIIENCARQGVKQVFISTGYKPEVVMRHFGDGSKLGLKLRYCIEPRPLGTGGAVKEAAALLTKPFFLLWGDNLMDISLTALGQIHQQEQKAVTMTLTPRTDVENFGVAKLQDNHIIQFVEKPSRELAPSNLINAGAFVIEPRCLDLLPEGVSSIEHDCFEKLATQKEIAAYIHQGQWFPTDTMEKYSLACQYFSPVINFEKKKVIIADVDGTICESCQKIRPEMAAAVNKLVKKGYRFAFISGTKMEDLLQMISSHLNAEHHLLASTGTKCCKVLPPTTRQICYNRSLTPEQRQEIIAAFEILAETFNIIPATSKEDQIQDRDSQITFSAIGRKAPIALKETYDPTGEKRRTWVAFLKEKLDPEKYEFNIGGTTSIDITEKGLDKEEGIREFLKYSHFAPEEVLYFGDKLYPGGNDYPASKIVDCLAVKNPEDTLAKLKELL